ncbi:MAG TPA: hypothetical protein VFS40_14505 [Gemmatimonadales bacterium]|nr:hypothetical protein [Gemmatimonadales bacterium]
MSLLSRSAGLLALMLGLGAAAAGAQESSDAFRWYLGGQAGVMSFRTPVQGRSGVFSTGANFLVTARRTGLLLSVDEALGDNEQTSFSDIATGQERSVVFNDIRKFTAALVAFPVQSRNFEPYVGVGVGLMQVVHPSVQNTVDAGDQAYAQTAADEVSTGSFGTLLGGLQLRAGRIALFGQYQLTTVPSLQAFFLSSDATVPAATGRMLNGATHTFTGGLRFSLGKAREGLGRSDD